jgi:hypothetical protein
MTSRSETANGAGALRWLATLLGTGHLALVVATGRLRWEHAAADVLLLGAAWSSPWARRFLRGGLPLWLTGILLDNQRLWLGLRGSIHTGDLWALEQGLFPATVDGLPGTWPQWFHANPHPALDVLCGLGYATYLAWVLGVAVLFFAWRSERFERLCWSFLAVNLVGVVTYVLYPAAPPWYVLAHGPGPADLAALPSAAGAARFDALLGIRLFEGFYSRNPNVFGAMPSLHVAYPMLVVWHTWERGRLWRTASVAYTLLIAFSAVYLTHHYVLDVLGGVAASLLTCAAVEFASARARVPATVGASASAVHEGDGRA